jgi:hypothetical protein
MARKKGSQKSLTSTPPPAESAAAPGETPPPPPEPQVDPEEARRHAAAQLAAAEAEAIKTTILPACLASALALDGSFDAQGYRTFLEDFVRDAGSPADPVERLLLEQLAFAHLRLAQLHAHAAQASEVEAARVYTSAAARLLAELRRLALAVRIYRQPASRGEAAGQQPQLKAV